MKDIYEINNIISNMTDLAFDRIDALLSDYWFSGCGKKEEQALAQAVAQYGLTVEEITLWDAQ